jgi:hypothetical protein
MRVASPEEGRQRIPHLGLGPAEIPPRDAARFGEEKAGYGRGTLLLAGGWDGGEISTPLGLGPVATDSETASRYSFGIRLVAVSSVRKFGRTDPVAF